eukprot:m.259941 g.259941  ORF g.259941 m.259941 type:complete len:56 (-) comp37650_c0_seq1:259-426(-)
MCRGSVHSLILHLIAFNFDGDELYDLPLSPPEVVCCLIGVLAGSFFPYFLFPFLA